MILEQSRGLRFFTVFILYVAQGVPIGLFWFAIPAWLAASGASPGDIASVGAMTALPWSLKFVNGFLMDRYTMLSMGRRRIWLIGAQGVMIAALVGCAIVQPTVSDIALLGAAGFIVNAATTFQDVAVDGLAVDIMPEDERGRASGMMFGGQAIGIALATAVSGWAIARFGPSGAYLVSAVLVTLVTLYVIAFRERAGERRLPWGSGTAHPRNLAISLDAWWPILKTTVVSLVKPISLLYVPILLVKGAFYGLMTGAGPLLGAGAGMAEERITSLSSMGALLAGLLGLTLGGWMADRIGSKRSTVLLFGVWAAFFGGIFAMASSWGDPRLATIVLLSWLAIDTLITVVALPIAMRLSSPSVAATQFTIYMAINNFGIALGAGLLGLTDPLGGLANVILVAALLSLAGGVIMALVRWPRRQSEGVVEALPMGDGMVPLVD